MTSDTRRTSFYAITSDPAIEIQRIEVPHFQRDYAQGRESDVVRRIRADFLDVLHAALVGDNSADVGLDFVYGGVDDGTFKPLDGQQRLTTLFLLHWYLASRSGHLEEEHGWKNFSYATRQSARMFCERLIGTPLPDDEEMPSAWIQDQPWYLFVWRHDPTIQSMLVMIDAIHERFGELDSAAVWERLTDEDAPAIWFLLLPLSELGSSADEAMRPEDLYIKMNSRGKPLTDFENFKAHFEKTIEWSHRVDEYAHKVDTIWSDLLWHLRGDDFLIDDEFLRYMEFITEICEWREGRDDGAGQQIGQRTRGVFGDENPLREGHLDFLFQAFDIWLAFENSTQTLFESFLTGDISDEPTKVRIFFRYGEGQDATLDLFEACCRSYGETRGTARVFSLGQTLMLYAVVLHLVEGTEDLPERIRALRNLIEGSPDELRLDRMPRILEDVHSIIRTGSIGSVEGLNQAQVEDEELKAAFIEQNPDLLPALCALEDNEILRGSLGAFELTADSFEKRASTFETLMSQPDLWTDLLGALLSVGEYHRQRLNTRPFIFGTDSKRHDSAWRSLLVGGGREALRTTREVLAEFLDRVADSPAPLEESLRSIMNGYLGECETNGLFDWRYYMVKYPAMREYGSSTYFAERPDETEPFAMGYSLCMLRAGGKALNGYYRDPYLLAIARELEDGVVEDKWFIGYETEPRRLPLTKSGASLRCVPAGLELRPPPESSDLGAFEGICRESGANADYVVKVPQADINDAGVDTVDRIQLGADIIRRLVAAGL